MEIKTLLYLNFLIVALLIIGLITMWFLNFKNYAEHTKTLELSELKEIDTKYLEKMNSKKL